MEKKNMALAFGIILMLSSTVMAASDSGFSVTYNKEASARSQLKMIDSALQANMKVIDQLNVRLDRLYQEKCVLQSVGSSDLKVTVDELANFNAKKATIQKSIDYFIGQNNRLQQNRETLTAVLGA